MKMLFYDVKKIELEYLVERLPKTIESYFFKNSINETTYVDLKYFDAEALSVFVSSELSQMFYQNLKN